MSDLLPFVIAGIATGSVYGLAGLGLVLTYKTSGVFNFAHGALATVAAYLFYVLNVEQGVPWVVATTVTVLVAGPAMGLVLELYARRIQTSNLAVQVAGTVGLLLVIAALIQLYFPTDVTRVVPTFLPQGSFRLGSTNVQWADGITFVFALSVTAALGAFFRGSRAGVQLRAVVDNPRLLALFGTSPTATRRLAWVMGSTLVSASGVLFATLLPLDPITLTFLVVAAFGAAAIGAFTNLPMTFTGGLVIGVLASLSTKWFSTGLLAGLPSSLPFVVLFAVLLAFPKRHLAGSPFVAQRLRPVWTAPIPLQLGGLAALVLFLAAVPTFAGIHLTAWTLMVAGIILFLSLSLLARTSGQVSLCHVTFTAIGAAAFSHLAVGSGLPWLVALLSAGLIAVPIGAVLSIPAIRLTGLYLGLATFGFGVLVQGMFYSQPYMFGDTGAGLPQPRPDFAIVDLTSDAGYYYLVLGFALAAAVIVIGLTRSRLGRLLRGIADSPLAVETSGTNANVTRVLVFCVSAFLASASGALAAVAQTTSSGDSYQPITSLLYFVIVVVVVGGEPWNALLASAAVTLVPSYLTGETTNTLLLLCFGAAAMLLAVAPARTLEVPHRLRRLLGRARPPRRAATVRSRPVPFTRPRVAPGALEIRDVTVRFGGVVAVDSVSLTATTGTITGLIGPNGAGKTTTFNAASGMVRPSSGSVLIDAHVVTRTSISARARMGLGRTFQQVALMESLPVRDNVAIGAEASCAGLNPFTHLLARRGRTASIARHTDEAMIACEIAHLADIPVAQLSTGQRRLVELARCLAGDFRILLMDEPSSGLDVVETKHFGRILKGAVERRGVGVLLVEHDMPLVLDVCSTVHVLDFGEHIFHGSPQQLAASPVVRSAYLGDSGVEEADDRRGAIV